MKRWKYLAAAIVKALFVLALSINVLTARKGVVYNEGIKETWYNLKMSRVVQRAQDNGIDGEYWIRKDGVKMYGDYVIVAAAWDAWPYGSIVQTSLGRGIVLDTGKFAETNKAQYDIAVNWK